jgi:FtsZ-binding cell division protein ZapB
MSETSTWMHVLQTIDQLRETALTTLRELEAENAALRAERDTWRARATALAGPLP